MHLRDKNNNPPPRNWSSLAQMSTGQENIFSLYPCAQAGHNVVLKLRSVFLSCVPRLCSLGSSLIPSVQKWMRANFCLICGKNHKQTNKHHNSKQIKTENAIKFRMIHKKSFLKRGFYHHKTPQCISKAHFLYHQHRYFQCLEKSIP